MSPTDATAADLPRDRALPADVTPLPARGRPRPIHGIDPDDLAACEASIRTGSFSFHAASRLMPARYRAPAMALYAFCRLADDSVDLQDEKTAAVLRLGERLDRAYAGRPENAPEDRAFTAMVEATGLPRALPEALLEGLAWDAMERRYATLSELRAYSARVASTVGAMMAVIMGVRDRHALARACDLGVAMQLTNIARDVGEDARAHRIYLPTEWLEDARIAEVNFLREPMPSDAVRDMVKRLLAEARRLYLRGEAGIPRLPFACRPGIFAARHIYDGIGTEVARAGYDSVSTRAHTSPAQKVGWLMLSGARAVTSAAMPCPAVLYAAPLDETAFLVEAAAREPSGDGAWGEGRAGELVALFAELKARDAARRGAMRPGPSRMRGGAVRIAAE
ncbi:phytoene/squalene synthase family protein [Rhodovulum sp. 12E13]|uniref:15-cis-phytoene synthase n=1 Tax=Rhodovulum sp. 12E13 TaxID=2203891 RepID=UPI000E19DB3C|nr:phytoene/squalene synthase family protein [Rhodovulum sp. 12E13]RDC74097.1 phytoene/squalene synthase family protein [Rhodovulum sp. 12E13]